MGGESLGYGGRGLSKGKLWAVGGANAQDPQGWKRPWGLWGVGLRLKEQKGPGRAPHLWSQRAGDLTWEPSRLPGLEWVGQTPSHLSCPSGLGGPLPPASPDFHGPDEALEGRGPAWELSRLPGPRGPGDCPLLLSCSSRRVPPTCLS